MKKRCVFLILLAAATLSAQQPQNISTGAGYSLHSFVNIGAGTQRQVANNAWDIAFSVTPDDAGVFINESVGSATGLLAIEAYYALTTDFSATPDPGIFEQFPLMNLEKTWSYGAFNEIRNPDDDADFGWGYLNPQTQEIEGGIVYVVRLRDDTFLKLQIQSLINGVYSFRYADFDGSGEVTRTIAKADHAGKLMAYYSFASDNVVDVEPADGFDLLFCRYTSLLDDPGGGEPIPYLVTGVLSGPGVEVAQADGVDPSTVMFEDYQGALSAELEIIGHDWKEFDLGAFQWILAEDRVYFVKTAENRVWKIQFTEFAGSSTGTAVFDKTDLGILSGVKDETSPVSTFDVFPNPASTHVHVLFSIKNSLTDDAHLRLMDAYGRIVSQYPVHVTSGLNAVTIPIHGMECGFYYLNLSVDDQSSIKKIVIAD